jgi:nucleoid DNA-binding protein
MNKKMLIEEMAKHSELSKAKLEDTLKLTIDSAKKLIKKHGKLQLVGFGTFKVKKRKARMGVNPQTGEKIKIKPSKTCTFKASKNFKGKL